MGSDEDDPTWRSAATADAAVDGGQPDAVERRLSRLEEEGAALLLSGAVDADRGTGACRRLLGATGEDAPPRRRVVVLADDDAAGLDHHLPAGAARDPAHLRVVVADGDPAGEGPSGTHPALRGIRVPETAVRYADPDLGSVGAAASEAVGALVAASPDLAPSELRVCVDSLSPWRDVPTEDLARFVHLLGHRVRRHRGQAHFHYHSSPDDPGVRSVEPFVDVHVTVDPSGDPPRYRWSFPDGPATEWLPVDPPAPAADDPSS